MILSMTGYGKGIVQDAELIVETEIKSLNNRFLDLSIRLPKSLSIKELEIRELVKKRIKRGKVSLNIYIKREGLDNRFAFIDEDGLKGAVSVLEQIKAKANVKSEITLDHLLNFQNIIFADSSEEIDREYKLAEEAVNRSIDELLKMREQEGNQLKDELIKRIGIIDAEVKKIESKITIAIKDYFEKLKTRAKELVENLMEYDDRLNMEMALLAEKYDITEETVRLNSHIKYFYEAVEKDDEAGRKLNFICQEMNREANTINSKSISSEISYHAMTIKEELEKIREQIQNIE